MGSPIATVTFTDNNSNGGGFTVTGSTASPQASDIGSVTVNRNRSSSTLTGTGLGDILIGRNNSDDTVIANEGNDVLIGGTGADRLTGGAGNDIFGFFSSTEGVDTIFDFSKVGGNTDKIYLDDAGFAAIGPSLDVAEFLSGAGVTTATTSTQRIIYDLSSGAVYYDADGSSAGAAVQILNLGVNTHPNLTASDFQIF